MTQLHPIVSDRIMHVTTNTFGREHIFAEDACAREVIETLYRVKQLHPFLLYAFVVMPNHCHFLMKCLSPMTISRIMNSFKSAVVMNLGYEKVWQRRFYLQIIDNPHPVRTYIHQNPVQAEIVDRAEDYPWSSASGRWPIDQFHT